MYDKFESPSAEVTHDLVVRILLSTIDKPQRILVLVKLDTNGKLRILDSRV
jgi:hypothetical protein